MSHRSPVRGEVLLISNGRIFISVWFTFLLYLSGGNNLQAANFTWDGAGNGGNLNVWRAKQNWGSPTAPGTCDNAFFTSVIGHSSTPTINGGSFTPINCITYSSGAAGFNITGCGTLRINGG